MQPIFEEGFKPVIRGSMASVAFPFAELVVFLMILPGVNRPEEITKSFLVGALLGGIVLTAVIALCILVLGPDFTARNMYPSYSLAKKISVWKFVERIEATWPS